MSVVTPLTTGVTVTSTGSSVQSPLPYSGDGGIARFAVFAATAPCYLSFGPFPATTGDILIQQGDSIELNVSGVYCFNVLSVSGTAKVTAIPNEIGSGAEPTALAILGRFGSDAHVYLPGIGTLSGLTAANYLDSALTTPATVDNPVGGVVDAIGVINATQPTTAAKPRLERGVRNLAWPSACTQAAGNATNTGGLLVPTGAAGTTRNLPFSATTQAVGVPHTIFIRAKPEGYTRIRFWFSNTGAGARFNLTTGVAVAESGASNASMTLESDGYWLCSCTYSQPTIAGSEVRVYVTDPNTGADTWVATPDGISGVRFKDAALFQGTLTAQQILAEGGIPLTTTAAASNPSAGKYSWAFDGGDSLALGSVPFQMSDDHAVIVGALSNTVAAGIIAAVSQGGAGTAQRSGAIAFDASGAIQCSWYDGTNYDNLLHSYPAGSVFVATAAKRSTTVYQRVNGVQRNTKAATSALATATTASIGAYINAGTPFTGSTGPILAIKGTLTDSEMLTLERLVANLTPNAPSF